MKDKGDDIVIDYYLDRVGLLSLSLGFGSYGLLCVFPFGVDLENMEFEFLFETYGIRFVSYVDPM